MLKRLLIFLLFCLLTFTSELLAATGDLVTQDALTKHFIILDTTTAVSNGQWFDTLGYENGSFFLIISAGTAAVTVNGSNLDTIPLAADNAVQLSSQTITNFVGISVMPRWVKVTVSSCAACTVRALVIFRRQSR